MSLSEYQSKRSFSKTPEPEGKRPKKAGNELVFVIQKHHASHLHYDFRLELKGMLKSWAVPKGPSMNPADKRLAMLVEDHPFDYKDFEGVIPEGNYGAGTVIIWDQGTYEPAESRPDKAGQEKVLLKEFYSGSLRIKLNGKKIRGEFALVQAKARGDNSWLLIKKQDEFAAEIDITASDKSVVSGKTIEEIRNDKKSKKWISNRNANGNLKAATKTASVKATGKKQALNEQELARPSGSNDDTVAEVRSSLPGVKKKTLVPSRYKPMQATLVAEPADEPGWIYEVLWDGLRAIASCNKGEVKIVSGNGEMVNERFAPVYSALKDLEIDVVFDGEIVVINDQGLSSLADLQVWQPGAEGELIYYVSDILWLEGAELLGLPLSKRRDLLQQVVPEGGAIRISESFDTSGTDFLGVARKMELRGIMAKQGDSPYAPGARSKTWLEIRTEPRQKAIIAGYTFKSGTGNTLDEIILGIYEGKQFTFIGQTREGITERLQTDMVKRFMRFHSTTPSNHAIGSGKIAPRTVANTEIKWLKPEIVCEVSYKQVTAEGLFRNIVFHGIKDDYSPQDIIRETTVAVTEAAVKEDPPPATKKARAPAKSKPKKEKETVFLNAKDDTQTKIVNGHELKFNNLSKVYWPKEKITKRDMLNYYYEVLPYMLPYMKDRPQSLNRHPNGITGENFYQKNVSGKVEPWVTTHDYQNTSKEGNKTFLVCTDEASLLYIAKLGCIEMNPWHSRLSAPDNPDWCVIDLDPDTTNTFEQVIEVAQVVKQILDAIEVPCYPKTSGSTGMHLYIPLGAKYDYDQSKQLAELIVTLTHQELSGFTSVERNPAKRKGKLYLDFLQNRPIQTIAAPYSLRPKPGATASAPLRWEEVKNGLSIQQFNIHNMPQRIKETGDLFHGVLGEGIDLGKVLEKAGSVFG